MVAKKVLVLGVTGMLGTMVYQVLSESPDIEVYGTHLSDPSDIFYFDILSGINKLKRLCLNTHHYDYFINCIGILPAKINEADSTTIRNAIKINSMFPHELSALAKEQGARVIHISTDGVFSGQAEHYYEDDVHDCKDFYGITKSLGEVSSENFLTLRCSIVGPSPFYGEGLLEWFLKQPSGIVIKGYTNHVWHGISTYQFGVLCRKIIDDNAFEEVRKEASVFHFAPNEPVTKYDLLYLFQKAFDRKIKIEATISDNKIYKRVLQTNYTGLKKIYPFNISTSEMVSELASYMKKNRERYLCK